MIKKGDGNWMRKDDRREIIFSIAVDRSCSHRKINHLHLCLESILKAQSCSSPVTRVLRIPSIGENGPELYRFSNNKAKLQLQIIRNSVLP
jgi:hypothetical protein